MPTQLTKFYLIPLLFACAAGPAPAALRFDGTNDMVTFGVAPGLGVTNFTIECWFKQQGAGKRAYTGTSGIYALPLVTKGMAENEAGATNMNYFFGIGTNNSGQAVLAADFEDMNNGLNHPIRGGALVASNAWQHAAVTYDVASSNWTLYVNGALDILTNVTGPSGITNVLMLLPRHDSLQHAALGASLRAGGATNADSGFFAGTLDEVRIWNYPRTAQQVATNRFLRISSAPGLVGRWALAEVSGTTAPDTAGGAINGTLVNGPVWTTDSAFRPSVTITAPADQASYPKGANILLTANASAPYGSITNVAFYVGTSKLGDATTGPIYSLTWNNVAIGNYVLTAVASDNLGVTNASAPINITVTAGASAATNLVFSFTNLWRYQQTSNLDGTDWKQPSYDDSAWPAGRGLLALEDCDCLPQPILTPLTLFTNRLTHYFRTHFAFSGNPTEASLLLSNLVDNGAAFYLNGVEIQRVRMPAGTITDSTPATESVGDATAYDTFLITDSLLTNLVVGDNVLAAEVHQMNYTSSDVVFGSSLSVVMNGTSAASGGLRFDGVNDMVTFGQAPALGVTNFTIECWFKRQGVGKRANTGTSGIYALPLVTKGMAEIEAGATNMNYFFGVGTNDSGQAVLAADFEDMNNGLNHPVRGTALVASNAWQHGAVTYDAAGSNWVLYLNGLPDATNVVTGPSGITNVLMLLPRYDSLQHAALGASLRTGGTTNADSGFFAGTLDEVRLWNYARTAQQIADNFARQVTNAAGMIARWSLDDATGATATNSIGGGVTGSLVNGPVWAEGYPFPNPINQAPTVPTGITPTNGATLVAVQAPLSVTVQDPENENLVVTFYGRPAQAATGEDFTLVALPDTQHYSAGINGGLPAMFTNQTQWIVNNRASRNIQYVTELGDCVQNGDNGGSDAEWRNATNALYRLENPLTTVLPEGVPYGVAVGNHDQSPNASAAGTTTFYNQYFGTPHFQGYAYYGGHYGTNNDNHYDLFSAGGMDFIVLYFEYDATMTTSSPVLAWANSVLTTNQSRRAIVVSHWIINDGFDATFSAQGQAIYDGLKGNTNLFLMLCGHVSPPEGQRTNVFQGRTVWTLMSDYQGRTGGGNGWLRLYEFSPANNVIHARTYSPWLDQFETDADSQFDIPYAMSSQNPFAVIGTSNGVPSGANASASWSNLAPSTTYEWYVTVSDGTTTTTGPVWQFTTGTGDTDTPIAHSQNLARPEDTPLAITLTGSDPQGSNLTFSVVTGPLHGTLSGTAPNLLYLPGTNYTGPDSFTFVVSDGALTSAVATVALTITPVNDAPTLTSLANQVISANGTAGPLALAVGDVETAAGSLTLSANSSNPALVPANNVAFGGSGANRTVTVTPAAGQSGNATITVSVSDGQLSASNSFVLTVVPLLIGTNSYTNTTTMTIPSSGSATPYPSVINVSGTAGVISNLTVTLRNLNHTWPADVDVLLVGPGGQKAMIFSDVGGGGDLNNVTVTLSDGAATALTATGQIVTGTYRPTDVEPGESGELDTFPGPAPAGPYAAPLSVFNGLSANGAWSLYVVDDAANDLGNIAAGWSLSITTVSSPPGPAITNQPQSQTVQCGGTATFTVGATGTAPLIYQWYVGASLLTGQTNASLALTGVGPASQGSYRATVQNAGGSVTSAPAILTVVDTNPPIILICASNRTINAGANCQAAMPDLTGQLVANDACSTVTIAQSPAAGTLAGLGQHLLTFTVKDASSNQATCSAAITVLDATAPAITACATNRTITAQTGCQAAIPDLTAQVTASDACGAVTLSQLPAPGTLVGLGDHLVTLTASDVATNQAVCSATITVLDATAPAITVCATNMTLNADTNCQAAIPDLTAQVTASDACGAVTLSQLPAPGTLVGLGDHLVTLTASDVATNQAVCSATITVLDATAPVITVCATNMTLSADTNCQAAIPDLTAQVTASDACGAVTLSQLPAPGTLVGLGDHLVTLTASDVASNQASCSATITVADANTPVIAAQPQSQTVLVGSAVSFTVAASSCSTVGYQWLFGTNALPEAILPTLTLTNVIASQAGEYSVILTNAAGSVTSAIAMLTFQLPSAPILTTGPVMLPNGHFHVGFAGTPNVPYTIKYAPAVNGPWQTLTNLTADLAGLFSLEDLTAPAAPMRFYRAVYP
jgi:hypothetical protein